MCGLPLIRSEYRLCVASYPIFQMMHEESLVKLITCVTSGRRDLHSVSAKMTKSLPPDVTHMMTFTRLPRFFSACTIEKLGGAWVRDKVMYVVDETLQCFTRCFEKQVEF